MSNKEPKYGIAWGRILFVVIVVLVLSVISNFSALPTGITDLFAPVNYDEIDPFSDMLVEVSGTEPFITLEYTDISGNPFLMENVKYEADKTSGLSNGDVVTITATASKRALKAAKKQFTRTTMQYTVEGQPFYLTPDTVLNDEQMTALRSCMDTLVEAAFLNGGEDVQHSAQGYLYDDTWKYWGSEPTATLVSCDNLEAVVFPASGGDPGYVEFLANATVTFCANQGNAQPETFSACMCITSKYIEMQGNDITFWEVSHVSFAENQEKAVLSLRKKDPTCKEIPLNT